MENLIRILILFIAIQIEISNGYLQKDVIFGEEQNPNHKELNRERNPLRFRPRVWSCQKGKCIKRIIETKSNDSKKSETERNKDTRYVVLSLFWSSE